MGQYTISARTTACETHSRILAGTRLAVSAAGRPAQPSFLRLRIESGSLNEELFTDYMGKPEMLELVSKWLGSQVYARLSGSTTSHWKDRG